MKKNADGVIDREDITSPVLRRIIKEVEEEKRGAVPGDPANVRNYNRIHNRHNRGR